MSIIDLALIGCGSLGRVHAQCIARIPEARFIAYADIVEEAAHSALEAFGSAPAGAEATALGGANATALGGANATALGGANATALGGAYATTDVGRVLADDRVQAVYICTHHDSHAPLAIAAARAGKHILIEKPLALTIAECEAVAEAVERAGVVLMPAFKMRFYPLVQRAHAFIPRPQVLVGQMMDNRWPDTHWAQDPVRGGANVHSQGCHTTDLLRYLSSSEPARVWACGGTMTHPGHASIDQCVAAIQFANGHAASWVQGDAAMGQFSSKFFFELFGEGKSVQLYDRLKKATFFDGRDTWVEERPEEEGFFLENREFIDALLGGRQPSLSALDGLQATRIVLAADRAIRTGQVQEL